MSGGALLSPWVVLPVAALLMLVVAAHIEVTRATGAPESWS